MEWGNESISEVENQQQTSYQTTNRWNLSQSIRISTLKREYHEYLIDGTRTKVNKLYIC